MFEGVNVELFEGVEFEDNEVFEGVEIEDVELFDDEDFFEDMLNADIYFYIYLKHKMKIK